LLHAFHPQYFFPVLFQKEVIGFLAGWQAGSVCLNVSCMYGEYVYTHYFGWYLVSTFTNETYVPSSVTFVM
jgi:hypothetical protein